MQANSEDHIALEIWPWLNSIFNIRYNALIISKLDETTEVKSSRPVQNNFLGTCNCIQVHDGIFRLKTKF